MHYLCRYFSFLESFGVEDRVISKFDDALIYVHYPKRKLHV